MKYHILNFKAIASGLALLGGVAAASAQNLNETVTVEGIYRIEEVQPDRINVLPRQEEVTLDHSDLKFDTAGVPTKFAPTALPLGVTGWGTTREAAARGYLDISLGSWLNSSVSAGYDVIRKPDTSLSVSLQHNSTSLWRPDLSQATHDVKRFRYDESLGARFARSFASKGLLEASIYYRLGYFNYYSYLPHAVTDIPSITELKYKAPTQTVNDISAMAHWSNPADKTLRWNVGLRAHYFGYRSLYLPGSNGQELMECSGERETHLDLLGGINYKWSNGSLLGLDGTLSALFYPRHHHSAPNYIYLHNLPDYGMLSLRPYYRFSKNNFIVNAGLDIDLTLNADGDASDSHYSFFHIAPDIRIDWRKDKMGIWLKLLGGSELQTLASGASFNYYRLPTLPTTEPIYTPIDAALGVEFGKWNGLSAGASFAYRVSKHVPLDGWYMAILNYGAIPMPGLGIDALFPTYGTGSQGTDLHGFRLNLHAAYEYSNILKASADLNYQPQHGTRGWWDGLDRPRWILNASIEANPIKALHLGVGYEYRGVRNIYTAYSAARVQPSVSGATKLASYRLPDICNLKASASYDITPKINVGVRANNLLNHHIFALPCLPTEGIDIQGTLTLMIND